jgi:hypothetical protein
MATFTVTLDYFLKYDGEDGPASDLDWNVTSPDSEGHRFDLRVTPSTSAGNGSAVLVHAAASVDATSLDAWSLERLGSALEKAVEKATEWWTSKRPYGPEAGRYRCPTPVVELARALKRARPQATVRVPLLGSDRDVVLGARDARKTLVACIEETYSFWSDQEERLAATSAKVDGRDLVITAATLPIAVDCAKAYLTAGQRRTAPRLAVPARPIWALGSVTIAALSFGMSWAPLNWPTLTTFATLTLVIVAAATGGARRLGAKPRITLFGLGPILILALFACLYGGASLLDGSLITSYGQPVHFLREPFLLALSLLTTVGVLDLATHSWVRSIAYLEMLLMAGVAGGAAIVAARRLSRRAREIVDELRLERQG